MKQTDTGKFEVNLTDPQIQDVLTKSRKHNPRLALLSDRDVFTIVFAEDCFACDGFIRIDSMKQLEEDFYFVSGTCNKCGRTSMWPTNIEFSEDEALV